MSTIPKASPAPADGARLSSAFADGFILLAIRRHAPEFRVQLDKDVELSAGALAVDPKEAAARAILLPEDLRKVLSRAFRPVEAAKAEYTVEFKALPQIRILPRPRAADFFAAFDAARAEMARILEADFYPHYEERVRARAAEYWGPRLGDAYERRIGRRLPPLGRLRGRIGVEAVRFSVAYEDAADAESAVAELAVELREKLAEAAEALDERLRAGKRLSDASFNDVLAQIATVRGFEAFMDRALLAKVDAVEARARDAALAARAARDLGTGTMTGAIVAARDTLLAGLGSVAEACRDRRGVDESVGRLVGPRRLRLAGGD